MLSIKLRRYLNWINPMTRINVGILPQELCRQHLLAECREIKRIPNAIRGGRVNLTGIPNEFTLGKGHVKFFYNKLLYLKNRYKLLYEEAISRKYNVTNFIDAWDNIDQSLMGDYVPTERDRLIVMERINERLLSMK